MTRLFSLLLLIPTIVFAHPHSFIDLKNEVQIENNHLQGFKMVWSLDELASADIIYEINSAIDKSEAIDKISQELTQTVIEGHYYSYLYNPENQPIKFKAKPRDVSLSVENGRVIYHFTMDLARPYLLEAPIKFFTYEPSYYIEMSYATPNALTVNNNTHCSAVYEEPQVNSQLRLYATGLDKNETPDMPAEDSQTLGAQFAQKVTIQCQN